MIVGLILITVVGIGLWHQRWEIQHAIKSTAVVANASRALRCRGVSRPILVMSREPWEITYSWAGGMGPGSVEVKIQSDGRALVSHQANESAAATLSTVTVPEDEIAAIARDVDESGLLCLTTEPRNGYRVFDLGKYSLSIAQGSYSKSVYVDECHSVASPADLFRTIRSIRALKPILGPEVEWGPYATSSVPQPCTDPADR